MDSPAGESPMQFAPLDGESSRESGIMQVGNLGAAELAERAAMPHSGGAHGGSADDAVARGAVARGAVDRVAVPTAEREASPVASAMQLGKDQDDEIEITTDGAEHPLSLHAAGDEDAIEVSDEEIESADPAVARATQPSPSSSFDVARSRPPIRPSLRPRSPSNLPLPPPRSGSLPPSGRGVDPWLLANKTLELAHANARITELEEHVAFRDARILELEENLASARRKLGESSREPSTAARNTFAGNSLGGNAPEVRAAAVVTETRAAVTLPSGPLRLESGAPRELNAEDEAEGDDFEDGERDSDFDADLRVGTSEGSFASGGTEEDLQQISGIGPRYEAALRKQGITRLSQIAAWSDADVRQVAKALKIPKSRIVKGRWVEVAREVIGSRAASE